MQYRVKRNLPDNQYVQLKSATLPECVSLIKSIASKWSELADNGLAFGEDPYVVHLEKRSLTVKQGDKIVDEYIVEEAK